MRLENGRFFAWFVNPDLSRFTFSDMFRTQVVGIGKSHPCHAAKCENIADTLQPFILDSFVDKDFQFGFRKVVFILVLFPLSS